MFGLHGASHQYTAFLRDQYNNLRSPTETKIFDGFLKGKLFCKFNQIHRIETNTPSDGPVGTYIVLQQIRMVPLDAIVQDRHDDAFPRVAFLPCWTDVHVQTVLGATILDAEKEKKKGKKPSVSSGNQSAVGRNQKKNRMAK